jgi:hypothetical protein
VVGGRGVPRAAGRLPAGEAEASARTRLEFFLRRWEAPSPTSEEFTGACFHHWRLRREADGWRVAAQVVERFDDLNDNAERLFATLRRGSTAESTIRRCRMKRQLAVSVSAAMLLAAAGSAALVARAADTSTGARDPVSARQFVGYWMGIDPLDGGDSRRGITRKHGGTFAVIGRDTVFTLCDGTDRAIVTVGDAVVSGSALVSDNLVIACTNSGSTVRLKLRYDVVERNVIRETLTTEGGDPVDKIIFHRVSAR